MRSIIKSMRKKTNQNPLFISAFLVVVLLLAFSPKSAGTTVYTDGENGFKISVPQNSEIIANPEGKETSVAFTFTNQKGENEYSIVVSTFAGILTSEELNKLLQTFENTLSSYERVSGGMTLVGETEAYVLVHSWHTGIGRVMQKQAIVDGKGKVFVLIFTAPEELYPNYEKTFDEILSSFKQI